MTPKTWARNDRWRENGWGMRLDHAVASPTLLDDKGEGPTITKIDHLTRVRGSDHIPICVETSGFEKNLQRHSGKTNTNSQVGETNPLFPGEEIEDCFAETLSHRAPAIDRQIAREVAMSLTKLATTSAMARANARVNTFTASSATGKTGVPHIDARSKTLT